MIQRYNTDDVIEACFCCEELWYSLINMHIYCCCGFLRSPEWAIWLNYEVVEFQPCSGIATVLDSVAYCYVHLPCLPCYYSVRHSYHTRSFTHLDVVCLQPRILTSWSASPILWFPIHDSLPLFPPTPCFPHLLQSFHKLTLCCFFPTPCIPPATSPLVALLAYTPQSYQLCESCLPSPANILFWIKYIYMNMESY